MNTLTTTKLKNRTLTLPAKVAKGWLDEEVAIRVSDDSIILKKVQPNFWDTWRKLKEVGKNISQKDIDEAIQYARLKQT